MQIAIWKDSCKCVEEKGHSRQSLWLYFLTKTEKNLCASVKGQSPLPLLNDGLLEASL